MADQHGAQQSVIEPPFFSNWADLFMPKIANAFLPLATRAEWLTPNVITIASFFLYVAGCLMLLADTPGHLFYTAVLLPLAYVADCLDGQVARKRKLSSALGNYLDKTLDVLKIYVLTASLGYAAYTNTQDITYIFLGFTACFFFNFRYYIKLETVLSQCTRDSAYLTACSVRRNELYREKESDYARLSKSFSGQFRLFWLKNRSIFWVDEAEFVVFTSVAALLNEIETVLWVLAVSQVLIACWRLFERGRLTQKQSPRLLEPMRK